MVVTGPRPVLLITDSLALILLTFSSFLLLASPLGMTGTLLNSWPILAISVLLLPASISYVSVGYVTYKRRKFPSRENLAMVPLKLPWHADRIAGSH